MHGELHDWIGRKFRLTQRSTTGRQHRTRRFCLTFRSRDLDVEPQTLLLQRRSPLENHAVGRQNVIAGEEPKNQQHGSALSGGEFTKARHVTFVTWILEERVKPDGVFGRHRARWAKVRAAEK
jgi:hypothetical protein